MVGRGCPFNCAYCCNRMLRDLYRGKGNYVRRHSVDRVLGEINKAKANYEIRSIDFIDDDFISDKGWLHSFLDRYRKEIQLPFRIFFLEEANN